MGIVAWNTDGTAVLLSRTSSSSGTEGISTQYTLVSAADGSRLDLSLDDTQNFDSRTQKVDVATCMRAAQTLKKALADKRFTAITIRPERCKSDRAVVQTGAATSKALADAKVGDLTKRRPADNRELKVEATLTAALGELPAESDVESPTGALIVVLSGVNGDESGPAHASVIAAGSALPRILIGDLR